MLDFFWMTMLTGHELKVYIRFQSPVFGTLLLPNSETWVNWNSRVSAPCCWTRFTWETDWETPFASEEIYKMHWALPNKMRVTLEITWRYCIVCWLFPPVDWENWVFEYVCCWYPLLVGCIWIKLIEREKGFFNIHIHTWLFPLFGL